MVQAGVLRKVAICGIQPCSSSGVSAMPVQNMPWVWAWYSFGTICQASTRLRK